MMLLKDRVAVVTGGTRGIGYAIVKKYLENGAKVVLFGSKEESVNKAVESLKEENPDWVVEGMWPNLTDSEEMEQAIAKVGEKYGRLDILVNNAGMQVRGDAEEIELSRWDKLVELNITAVFELSQLAARQMIPRGGGKIINVASMLSFFGGFRCSPYAASKGAVAQLTKACSNEWAGKGINVNAIAPGYMDTPLNTTIINDPERNREITLRIPAHRWGLPEDLKGTVIYLASGAADYVSGAIIPIDGGYLGR